MEPILETLNDGVVIGDADSGQFSCQHSLRGMTGMLRGAIIGRDARQLNLGAEDYARSGISKENVRRAGPRRVLPCREGWRATARVISVRASMGRGRAFHDAR